MEIKFTVPGPPKGKQRPRVCRINGRSVAYTPRQTIEYENLIRASYTAISKAKFERNLVYLPFSLFRNMPARKQKN